MKPKLNAAFWKWFGSSVVRNEDGSPMVVYHGTTSKRFSVFDPLRFGESVGRPSLGFWFSSEKWMADMYSDGKTPIQLFIKVENPLFIPSSDVIKSKRSPEEWATHAKEHGFDGLILEDKNSYVYGVFDNKQIKSVANDGTWDDDDPDIRSNPAKSEVIVRGDEFMLMLGGKKIGQAFVNQTRPGEYILSAMDIDEEYQRQGWGTSLMKKIYSVLKKSGAEVMRSAIEGSGMVQILESVFGRGNVRYFGRGGEISFNEAVEIMDVEFGRTLSAAHFHKRGKRYGAYADNPDIRSNPEDEPTPENDRLISELGDDVSDPWDAGSLRRFVWLDATSRKGAIQEANRLIASGLKLNHEGPESIDGKNYLHVGGEEWVKILYDDYGKIGWFAELAIEDLPDGFVLYSNDPFIMDKDKYSAYSAMIVSDVYERIPPNCVRLVGVHDTKKYIAEHFPDEEYEGPGDTIDDLDIGSNPIKEFPLDPMKLTNASRILKYLRDVKLPTGFEGWSDVQFLAYAQAVKNKKAHLENWMVENREELRSADRQYVDALHLLQKRYARILKMMGEG